MNIAVLSIDDVDFFLVRRQGNAVAYMRIAVIREIRYWNVVNNVSCCNVADLKTKVFCKCHVRNGLVAVECERPHAIKCRADDPEDLICAGVRYVKVVRPSGHVDKFTVRTDDCIVSLIDSIDRVNNVSVIRVDNVPSAGLRCGAIDRLAVRSDCMAVNASRVNRLPNGLLVDEIEFEYRCSRVPGAQVHHPRRCVGHGTPNAFNRGYRYSFDEAVLIVDVEYIQIGFSDDV